MWHHINILSLLYKICLLVLLIPTGKYCLIMKYKLVKRGTYGGIQGMIDYGKLTQSNNDVVIIKSKSY